MDALSELRDRGCLLKVQDELGGAIEQIPGTDIWIDNIGEFRPGEGYKVRVSCDETLCITPPPGSSLKSALTEVPRPEHFHTAWEGNGHDHMNIYLFDVSLDGAMLQAGDEIGVFDGPLCVGAAVITDAAAEYISIAASADDPTTERIDGFVEGNTPSFRIWRSSAQEEIRSGTAEYLHGCRNVFEKMGTAMVNLRAESQSTWIEDVMIIQYAKVYPNPFSDEIILEFSLVRSSNITIQIRNVLGTVVVNRKIEDLESGVNQWTWDGKNGTGSEVSPGLYFMHMYFGDNMHPMAIRVLKQ
jgi:hypothetical protein